jgi:signal transduction histidine kinase/ActR/RegA family two-component response regulator
MEQRVLIYAPVGKDARHVSQVLERANLECFICLHTTEIITELGKGVGVLFMVDEALTVDFLKSITDFLKHQKTWSDLPIVVLSKRGLDSPGIRAIYQQLGNVTLLERPVQSVTLLTAVNSALRGRRRQYKMRELDRRKDEFLAMLAHELRNPLAPIGAAAELLQLVTLDERVKQTSEIITRQVDHMTSLVNDLLDVSRVTSGLIQLNATPMDIRYVANDAVEQVAPIMRERRHHLTLQLPPDTTMVLGDKKRLVQILTNLLNNAAKYTPEGGNILLKTEVRDSHVVLEVIDNGIGMEPELVSRVFDLFVQAERTSDRTLGGLGLGLALVRSLVELHGGSVVCASDGIGKGSRFTVSLPRLIESDQHFNNVEKALQAHNASRPLRILVVDDNKDAAAMIAMYLEALGHEVLVEHSAKRALERARIEAPEVLLLDIGLPEMDGNELAKRLRSQSETAKSILIAATGYGQEQDRINSLNAGFNHHLVKPVDTKKLASILAKISETQ